MIKKYFIADNHFYHSNILKYLDRKFQSVEEMDQHMIEQWNLKVPKDGIVYHIGDLAFLTRNAVEEMAKLVEQLNGQIILVTGNHDLIAHKKPDEILKATNKIAQITPYKEIKVQDSEIGEKYKQKIVMSHYPFLRWHHVGQGSWHLFGHVHGTLGQGHTPQALDVGVDGPNITNYQPLSYEEVKTIITRRLLEQEAETKPWKS